MSSRIDIQTVIGLFFASIVASGCATIIDGGPQSIQISSDPTGADITVLNMNTGDIVTQSATPYTAVLERGAGYFTRGMYQITLNMPGYKEQTFIVEGAVNIGPYVFGNILAGGPIGSLIVDPITGAMWKLEPTSIHSLMSQEDTVPEQGKELALVITTDAPETAIERNP
ncbi:MAG: hypothetical protein OEZ04_08275 [Nitrospinota bacterium]|nr:hypothetical protein [Nitrospinota bacterium]